MIEIHSGDAFNIAPAILSQVNCVITDPPYDGDAGARFYALLMESQFRGRIIMFCNPENQHFKADEYLFWVKTPSTKNYSKHCGRFVEIILVGDGPQFNPLHWSQMTGVYDDRLIRPPVHPFQKPLTLIERLVRIYSNPGDTILDPFCGAGTTGLAAKGNYRNFIGIELNPIWAEYSKNELDLS